MNLIVKHPGKEPRIIKSDDIGDTMDHLFDIACVALSTRDWVVLCEDNGYAMKLEPNFPRVTDGHIIVGPVLFVGREGPDFTGLKPDDVQEIINKPFHWRKEVTP